MLRIFRYYILLLSVVMALKAAVGGEDELSAFRKLFRHKRFEHLSAVQKLQSFDPSDSRRDKLLTSMLDQMWVVMGRAKLQLEKKPEATGLGAPIGHYFSQLDAEAKDAAALLMENTCFLGDILLRFPGFVHSKFKSNAEALLTFKWGISYVVQSAVLTADEDKSTLKLLDLVSQEIGVKEKSPDYRNPYAEKPNKQKRFADPPPKPKKKERKKLPKGPKMSRTEL